MYTTENNRQREIERQLDRQEEVGTDRCIQHRTIGTERQRDSQIDRRRRQVQIDVYNIEQQIEKDREIVKQTGGGRYRQMYTTQNNRQREIERQSDKTGGGRRYRQMYTTQNDRQREKKRQQDREEEVGTD